MLEYGIRAMTNLLQLVEASSAAYPACRLPTPDSAAVTTKVLAGRGERCPRLPRNHIRVAARDRFEGDRVCTRMVKRRKYILESGRDCYALLDAQYRQNLRCFRNGPKPKPIFRSNHAAPPAPNNTNKNTHSPLEYNSSAV